jgi:hypothetical protein
LVQSFVTVVNVLSEEPQVTDDSTCVLLSLKVPVAVKFCVKPTENDGAAGLMAIVTSPDGVSVAGRIKLDWASGMLKSPVKTKPPAKRTEPSFNRVAVWLKR